ncbi:MAG: MBL fold metallo-hydrolase [Clostridia bacterium]|nr:MBL fold metallo-hydrolase [Clostridia bacterium]
MKESSKFINKILVLALSLIMLLLSCPFVCTALAIEGKTQAEDSEVVDTKNKLQITYYNVGNGDCAFVKWNNFEMLIDTGEKAGNLDVFAGYNKIIQTIKEKCEDKCLDYIVATHGDSDHIGLMDQVLNAFDKTGDLSGYKLKNILDFDSENIAGMYKDLYNRYATARQKRVDDKTNYIPVTTCFKSKTFDSDLTKQKIVAEFLLM